VHLQLAIERAVRIGNDTDTVAAITGSLLGAYWGATAVPHRWRRALHGRVTYHQPDLQLADLDRLARLAINNGKPDDIGWPGIDRLLPYYQRHYPANPIAAQLDDGVTIGNVHALPDDVDAVISLCRMGQTDQPDSIEHHVIGLLDTTPADNPNLSFVLADTADLIASITAQHKRVFVHCVKAESRTPTLAATYLVRHHAMTPDDAVNRVATLIPGRPQPFLADAIRNASA